MAITPELSRQVAQIIGHAWVPPSFSTREQIISAMEDVETYDQLPNDIKELLDTIKNQPKPAYLPGSKESRASQLSKVERRIVKKSSICERCRLNDDPNNVPVHPHCDCDVISDSIESGVADPQSRFLQPMTPDDVPMQLFGFDELIDLPPGIQLNPDTVAILDGDTARFSDLARWLEQMEPYLQQGSQFVSIVVDEDTDEAVQQVSETVEAIAEDTDQFAEAIRNRKMWFAIAKSVVF